MQEEFESENFRDILCKTQNVINESDSLKSTQIFEIERLNYFKIKAFLDTRDEQIDKLSNEKKVSFWEIVLENSKVLDAMHIKTKGFALNFVKKLYCGFLPDGNSVCIKMEFTANKYVENTYFTKEIDLSANKSTSSELLRKTDTLSSFFKILTGEINDADLFEIFYEIYKNAGAFFMQS